jgi:hypothetical protein
MMRGAIETYGGSGRLGWRIRFPSVNNSVIETLVIDRNQWDNLKTTDIGKEDFVDVIAEIIRKRDVDFYNDGTLAIKT